MGGTENITYYEHQVFDMLHGEASVTVPEQTPKQSWLHPKQRVKIN